MTDKEIIAIWDDIARAIETGEKSGAKVTVVRMTVEQAEATYNLIKRLKRENNSYRNKAQAKKGEIARLNARNNELNALNKTASIEAIKEFAERLKAEYIFWKIEDGSLRKIIPIYAIDYVVKEMVGE